MTRFVFVVALCAGVGGSVANVACSGEETEPPVQQPQATSQQGIGGTPTSGIQAPAEGVLTCHQVSAGLCMQCSAGAACETPTMESSCVGAGHAFSRAPCPLEGAFGTCDRDNGMRTVFYSGPPRNHSEMAMRPLCENAWRGTFTLL